MIRIRTLWILAVSETRAERHPPAYHPDPSSVHYLVVYRSKYMVIGLYSMTSMLKDPHRSLRSHLRIVFGRNP